MSSEPHNSSAPAPAPLERDKSGKSQVMISSEILLSLLATPAVLGLIGARALADLLQSMGQTSEEVFRGDRLPVLNFPKVEDD